MSSIPATITQIQNCDNLHLVKFDTHGQTLCMMSLELHENIQVGTKVNLAVKPTHITIAKNVNDAISCANQLQTTIESIDNGKLLSSIKLHFSDTTLEAIITQEQTKKMQLAPKDQVVALIPESELFIKEVLDD